MTSSAKTAATASADDDDPPPKKPPKYCPWCGEEVQKKWTPNKLFSIHQRMGIRCTYVCFSCKVAVRAFKFPPRPLFATKREARAEAARFRDELEASGFDSVYLRDLYARGKCTCDRYPSHLPMAAPPCPIHRPLPDDRSPRSTRSTRSGSRA